MRKCNHYLIQELISEKVYNYYHPLYGEDFIWGFFDEDILIELDIIRDKWEEYLKSTLSPEEFININKTIIINDWYFGGNYQESGLRSNVDSVVSNKDYPYISAHVLGKGFDLKPGNKLYVQFHNFIYLLMSTGVLIKFKRKESIKSAPTWCHIDCFRTKDGNPVIFNV